ncbi:MULTISPECIES: hypothetical protein [Chryseobacterium]|uniref:Plasminogen-binding protein PgbA N-terminal domain-containing protein n=1 Tax=Chryseobacterium camelliae TaxID=1265445 RepID=A0ABU0TQ06_9FLAO|nr:MULTISPECIES: hypothetical protein [Chryseobacterium]MDT3407787.1 hypothetical protein [Pseudacidovorax intermedius]MDQ1098358.1 hypothetical protein [Chryseobacterium camelliae]MDQ1102284.1 hypothetical protein [Chryseobacterium sp. SORGH_AS_1048]MDR6085722.1 hypothetical protein [Chryseobacterium sp. SORGH_AS_0909]MDR6130087.1 hypothetical protein [Chryseobacterium sp. SORGH_AS_1175]
MKKSTLLFLLIVWSSLINAQSITFVSERTGKPLPKISVLGKQGHILASSDIDGTIDKQSLKPDQEKFQLVYKNIPIDTLSYSDFDQPVIKINDQVTEIDPVPVKNNKSGKYIYVTGNFNTYTTLNNTVNGYADGIVRYIFNSKTKKLKAIRIQQYRIFRVLKSELNLKKSSSWEFSTFMQVPDIKWVGNVDLYKKSKNMVYQAVKSSKSDKIEIKDVQYPEKDIAFLGYHFFYARNIINIAYNKDSRKTLEDLLEYNQNRSIKLKYKNEPSYNILHIYANFYPTSFDSGDHKDDHKVKFDLDRSYYTSKYWEDPSFPDMQTILNSFQKGDLKEQQNTDSTNTIKHTT